MLHGWRLVADKFVCTPLRPSFVHRPRLTQRIAQGIQLAHKLTLISAPAGFGKTTLVGEWIANSQQSAAWLSKVVTSDS